MGKKTEHLDTQVIMCTPPSYRHRISCSQSGMSSSLLTLRSVLPSACIIQLWILGC